MANTSISYKHHNGTWVGVNGTTVSVGLLSTQWNDVQKEASFVPWDNPDNLISFETYHTVSVIVHCGLYPTLLLTGVPTNIISCLVFYKQSLRDRMNLCLFVLALVDSLHIVSANVAAVKSFIEFWDLALAEAYYIMVLARFIFVLFAMRTASGLITMVVAVERCVCVVFPLRANSIMRTRTMGALLATIIVIVITGFSIIVFRSEVVTVIDETSGQVRYLITISSFFQKHPIFYDIVHDVILSFAVPLVTFVVVGVATAITVIKLRTAMAWRASTSSGRSDNHSQQQQAALTKMLVILSCVFMACSAPATVLSIVRLVVPKFSPFGRYYNFFFASHEVGYCLVNINSAVNFYVYYLRSSRFREDVRTMFGQASKREIVKSTLDSTMTMTSEY